MSGANDLLKTIKNTMLVPTHRAGWPFITAFAISTALLTALWAPLFWIGLILTCWCVYFFRDPERVTPLRPNLIVSPGDGLVQKITTVTPPAELDMGIEPMTRISIFLNVFDVHVNRIPIGGTIRKLHYHPGLFLNASLDKASEDNERQLVSITTNSGVRVGVIQIAGLVARRILCDLKEGQQVQTGERFGIIRFGSRVDVFLPTDSTVLALEGQRAVGGETVLAELKAQSGEYMAPSMIGGA